MIQSLPVHAGYDGDYNDMYGDVILPDPIGTTDIEEAKAMYPTGTHTFYIKNDIKYVSPDGQVFDKAFDYFYYMRSNYEYYTDAKSTAEIAEIASDYLWNLMSGISNPALEAQVTNFYNSWSLTKQMLDEGRIETISAIYVDLTWEERCKLGLDIQRNQ